MFEIMKKTVAAEDLKINTRGLEDINNQIENTVSQEKRVELLKKAEQVEMELNKIEKIIGISAEEMLSFYETIAPEDARDIVTKTIEKIPMGFMRGALWTVDNLKQCGGKIILWASKKSPREAAIIAASVMILTLGSGIAQEATADDGMPIEITYMSKANSSNESVNTNAAQDSLGELETVRVPEGANPVLDGGLRIPEDAGANQSYGQDDMPYPGVTVNGKSVHKLKEGEYGNSDSENEGGIRKGIINIH